MATRYVCCFCSNNFEDSTPAGTCAACMACVVGGCTDPSLCATCVQLHSRTRMFDGHVVLSFGSSDPSVLALEPFGVASCGTLCRRHPGKAVTMHCTVCIGDRVLLCELCLPDHLQHAASSVTRLADLVESARQTVAKALLQPAEMRLAPKSFVEDVRAQAQAAAARKVMLSNSADSAAAAIDDIETLLITAVRSRCSELRVELASKAQAKCLVLDAELNAADEALATSEGTAAAAQRALEVLGDADLVMHASTIASRLTAVRTASASLRLVEPPKLEFTAETTDAVVLGIRGIGGLVSVRMPTAADVQLVPAQTEGIVFLGTPRVLLFRLIFTPEARALADLYADTWAAALAQALVVELALTQAGSSSSSPIAAVQQSAGSTGVDVSIDLPVTAAVGDIVSLVSMTIAHQPVSGANTVPPFEIKARRGLLAPLEFVDAVNALSTCTPAVSASGLIYIAKAASKDVIAFDGASCSVSPELFSKAHVGVTPLSRVAAFVDYSNTLLLADGDDQRGLVVAFDAATRAARWPAPAALGSNCYGLCALPSHGVCVAAVNDAGMLHVRCLHDGSAVGSPVRASDTHKFVMQLAADSANGFVFAGAYKPHVVTYFAWNVVSETLDPRGPLAAVGTLENHAMLTVMPPVPGKPATSGFLVVGTLNTPGLRIVSLPDMTLVQTVELRGMKVSGLAADPHGSAIVVCDSASKSVHVLSWPLDGMHV
jgi:hypothetical protein